MTKGTTSYPYDGSTDCAVCGAEVKVRCQFSIVPPEPRTRDYPGAPGMVEVWDVTHDERCPECFTPVTLSDRDRADLAASIGDELRTAATP